MMEPCRVTSELVTEVLETVRKYYIAGSNS
jgi:hypothetical protein